MLSTTFFLQLPGNKYHVNCVASTPEPALRFGQDKIYNVLKKTDEHDVSQHIDCHIEMGELPRLLPHSALSPFCSYARIMLEFFHCCGRHIADHQSMIKLCSLLCKAHPPSLMTSAWTLLGPAALLSLRLRMAFSISSKDDGSSRFGMIGSVGRSSRRPGSVMWTLFSRF